VRSLMLTLVVSATVVAVVAIVRLGGQEPELIGVGALAMGRASGSFGHPNALASFFVLALPAALVFAFVPTAALRPLIVAGFAAIFAALLFSLSRSGIVASAVALLVLLAWRPVRRAAGLLALAMLILTLAGSNPLAGSETTELVTKRLESISHAEGDDRLVLWRETPQIIQDHPVIGVGAGNFPSASARYGIVPSVGSPDEFAHAHSIPLTITAERGLLGLAALLWGGIALAMLVIRACRRREGFDRGIAFALASGLTGFAIQGALDYALGANVIVALLFVLAGSASVLAESH
jgi:putative inorganic carbon (hco3(-)) transporter